MAVEREAESMSKSFDERVHPTSDDEETIRRQATIARSVTSMARALHQSPDPAADMRFCGRCFEALAQMYEEEQ